MAIDQRNHGAARPEHSDTPEQSAAEAQAEQQAKSGEAIARAAEALLREHPDATVAGLSATA